MHSVSSAARLCGVSPSTLRAWERRYGVVEPIRTEGGYRVYDDAALRRLTRMSSLIASGWSPRHAAAYVMNEDGEGDGALPIGHVEEETPDPVPPTMKEERQHLEVLLDAAERLDAPRVSDELDFAFSIHSFTDLVDRWLRPVVNAIREGGESGRLSQAGEHFLRAGIERRLRTIFAEAEQPPTGPSVVIGTPPGEHRVLTALGFATCLRMEGCAVTYLGDGLQTQTWLDSVAESSPDVVVVIVPADEDAPGASGLIAELAAVALELPVYAAGDGVEQVTGEHATLLTGPISKAVTRIRSENAPARDALTAPDGAGDVDRVAARA